MSMLFKRIKDWATSITAFRTGDVIPVDGPSGTAKMSKDDLLKETAENALDSIHSLNDTATETDLVAGNYLALDGIAGTKKLPAEDVLGASNLFSFSKTETIASGYNFSNIKIIGFNEKDIRVTLTKNISGLFKFVAYVSVSGSLVQVGVIECTTASEHRASAVLSIPAGSNERLILNNASGYELTITADVTGNFAKKIADVSEELFAETKRATGAENANAGNISTLDNAWMRRHVFRYKSELESVVDGVYLFGIPSNKQYALRRYVDGSFKNWQLFELNRNWSIVGNTINGKSPKDGVYEIVKTNDNSVVVGYISERKEPPTTTTDFEELRVETCFDIHYNPSLALWTNCYRKYPSVVEINVKTDGTGDYTKIKDALDSITDSSEAKQYVVYIHEGTYNIEDEVFGGDYSQQPTGLFIPDYVSLVGVGKRANIVIDGRLDSNNINISQSTAFSTVNSLGNVSLENLTIYAKNCRYCWHSDGGWTTPNPNVTMKAKNCHFKNFAPDSSDATLLWQNNTAVGFGLQSGEKFIAERCVFETDAAKTGVPAYGSHNWDKRSLPPVPCIQQFTECEFKNTTYNIAFRVGYLGSETDDQVIINGCKFSYDGSNPNIWVHDEANASIPCDYWLYLVANKQVHITADAVYKKFEILSDNS